MSALWVEADGDDDAVREAHAQIDGARFELWEKQRLVARNDGAANGS